MLPLWARVNLGAMAMKDYSTFPKAAALLEPQHQIFNVISSKLISGGLPLCISAAQASPTESQNSIHLLILDF